MADLRVHPDRLEIRLSRAEKLWALRRDDLVVDREGIRSVTITEDPWIWIRGIRAPGVGIPLTLAVGTWKFHGGEDFVIVKGKMRSAAVIDLDPERDPGYARVIVSTPHVDRLVEALRVPGDDQREPGGEKI